METLEKIKGVCPVCGKEIFELEAKVDATIEYRYYPDGKPMEQTDINEDVPYTFVCPECGEDVASTYNEAEAIFTR